MGKLLGLILIAAAVAIAFFSYEDFRWSRANTGEQFAILIERDLEQLVEKQILPSAWHQLASVEFHSTTPTSKEWLNQATPDIKTIANGKYHLEVATTDWQEGEQYGGIAQFSLVELDSGNKVWEFGRTYKIGPDSSPLEITEADELEPFEDSAE